MSERGQEPTFASRSFFRMLRQGAPKPLLRTYLTARSKPLALIVASALVDISSLTRVFAASGSFAAVLMPALMTR